MFVFVSFLGLQDFWRGEQKGMGTDKNPLNNGQPLYKEQLPKCK